MIIHQPETKKENGQFIVSARIETQRGVNFPHELWFSVPEEHRLKVSPRADYFATTLLRIARILGEDLEVRGELSPQLLFGMREYLKVHAAWSGNYNIINISASNPVPAERKTQGPAASCSISGGIDSFHTLWSQLPENEPTVDLQVKYGIYGANFTSPNQSNIYEKQYIPGLSKLLEVMGVELLAVNTNSLSFRVADEWLSISTARLTIPLLFSPVISTHFVPSTDTYHTLKPWGVHPLTDHLFSLESLRIFTHTSDMLRFEKLRAMAGWAPFYEYLYVCNNHNSVLLNDSTCPKCTRTILMANLLNIDEKITTFHMPFRKRNLLRRLIKSRNHYLSFKVMVMHAIRIRKWSLVPFMIFPVIVYKLTRWIKPLLGYKFK
ncbi:MAG: hypothetical protein N2C13_00105 [Chloroflexota bacterium]